MVSVTPRTGSTAGGTVVTISGSNFAQVNEVTFGGTPGTGLLVNSTLLTVTTPPGTVGAKDVVVTSSGGSATLSGGFTYEAPPAIASLTPTAGTSNGGTVVTITGTDLTNATGVTFGGAAGTGLSVVSATRLRVTAPAGTGVVDVTVTSPSGSATAANAFTYQTATISTLAGTGLTTTPGDGGAATSADLAEPSGLALDPSGNLYIASRAAARVRAVCGTTGTYFGVPMTAGNIYTVAGAGTAGFSGDGGSATSAQLQSPVAVAFDSAGNLYIADQDNHRIRVVCNTDGTYFGVAMTANNIYTVCGDGVSGDGGDGAAATAASLVSPCGLAFDEAGNLYIADSQTPRIRVVCNTDGTYFGVAMTANDIYTVAGSATSGSSGDGGAATSAQLSACRGLAFDEVGNLFISAAGNDRVRVVCRTAGTYFGVAMTADNIYTIAGTTAGTAGDGGAATAARIDEPQGLAFDGAGNLAIADSSGHRVRMVCRVAGTHFGVVMAANNIYTVAGTTSGFSGDGGPATAAQLSGCVGVVVDAAGRLVIGDSGNHRVRVVGPQGTPTIDSVSPGTGPTAGGTSVTITGTNLTGATSVTFGGATGAGLTVVSSTRITVTTPAGAAGAQDVVVTTPTGSATSTGAFTYSNGPTITSLTPDNGFAAGGDTVTIKGTNLTGTQTVTFAGMPTAFTVVSSTEVEAITPPGTPGPATVEVTTLDGTAVAPTPFTYN